jgi:hypothetical protein
MCFASRHVVGVGVGVIRTGHREYSCKVCHDVRVLVVRMEW